MPNLVTSEATRKTILRFACINILLEDIEDGKLRGRLLEQRSHLVRLLRDTRRSGQRQSKATYYIGGEVQFYFDIDEPLSRTTDSIPTVQALIDTVNETVQEACYDAFEVISPGFRQSGKVVLPRIAGGHDQYLQDLTLQGTSLSWQY